MSQRTALALVMEEFSELVSEGAQGQLVFACRRRLSWPGSQVIRCARPGCVWCVGAGTRPPGHEGVSEPNAWALGGPRGGGDAGRGGGSGV